jgi:hypothetical protein
MMTDKELITPEKRRAILEMVLKVFKPRKKPPILKLVEKPHDDQG